MKSSPKKRSAVKTVRGIKTAKLYEGSLREGQSDTKNPERGDVPRVRETPQKDPLQLQLSNLDSKWYLQPHSGISSAHGSGGLRGRSKNC